MALATVVNMPSRARALEPASVSTTSVRQAMASLVARLIAHPPHPIPVGDPRPDDFEDRAEHIRSAGKAFTDYLRAIADETASHSHYIDRERLFSEIAEIDNWLSDLAGDMQGAR